MTVESWPSNHVLKSGCIHCTEISCKFPIISLEERKWQRLMGFKLKLCQLLLVYHNCLYWAPLCFPFFCNYLPSITEGIEGDPQFHMYADDTTAYVSAPTYDLVASKLNEVLAGLYTWCCESCLTPHPTKTEYTLLSGCRQLTGPLKTSY